ncbi:cell division protein CrgA [Streptomyces sp. 3MP-14]|uniref:Cell division protein CrgA n=1 Tax=Streptomyces mimosae TaxID=2586635 RepID=A0A5N6A3Y5_9ACTN|nr:MULTISPECIES: cell division protein CrgA [Streptomyces]KAB8163371.1 cell division protein CrgA [Streptomyces mimosae]KAB8174648.1 cell division protein CrgA [Streptomyces sp. 3MP-14]
MPKSRVRKKKDGSYAPSEKPAATKLDMSSGRRWVAPLMLALFGIGLAWIVVYYMTKADLPVGALGDWNIVVGFGFIALGFVVSTQWK